jgi:flagellar motor protein MotB
MIALRTVGALLLLVASGLSTGCQSRMFAENKDLHNQNRELQTKLDAETRARMAAEQRASSADPGQLTAMQGEIATRDAKISELEKALAAAAADQPAPAANGGGGNSKIAGLETTYDAKAGTVTVNVPGDVLFASGQAELKSSAQSTLNNVITAIKKNHGGKKVYVDGYTDTDPITKTKDKWEDNLDLSAARARSVTKYLTSNGLSAGQVSPRAMGATAPKASKDKSRRVEIVVVVK